MRFHYYEILFFNYDLHVGRHLPTGFHYREPSTMNNSEQLVYFTRG